MTVALLKGTPIGDVKTRASYQVVVERKNLPKFESINKKEFTNERTNH